jgi:hypothetical protein
MVKGRRVNPHRRDQVTAGPPLRAIAPQTAGTVAVMPLSKSGEDDQRKAQIRADPADSHQMPALLPNRTC